MLKASRFTSMKKIADLQQCQK